MSSKSGIWFRDDGFAQCTGVRHAFVGSGFSQVRLLWWTLGAYMPETGGLSSRGAIMGFYGEQVLPRLMDVTLGRAMEQVRSRAAEGLAGEVLELGFGSGRNLPHLPAGVTRLLAVEPASVGVRLAGARIAAAPFPVELIGLTGEALALDEASVDHALVTFTLCTIPDVERALAEVHRVLRPGGTLHFVEHGLSQKPGVVRWQERLNPLWGRMFGGCHLNRPIDALIEKSGLALETLEQRVFSRPELAAHLYEGIAVKAS
jgi:ubiquinone/menaquinone biosynthesis C-methylase UbiE